MSSSERKRPKIDPYFEGEPHPLPFTRAWMEDYKRAQGRPSDEAVGAGPPDLQALVERAGRRHAAAIGEECVKEPLDEKGNLKRPPHQGGYQHITAEEWAAYDAAMAAYQRRRRGL